VSAQLIAQLKATRASIDATLALLEGGAVVGAATVGGPAPSASGLSADAIAAQQHHLAQRRQDASSNCPKCNAPRKARESNQGFGMTSSQARELCGVCGHVFETA
jgi:hypothetical protein